MKEQFSSTDAHQHRPDAARESTKPRASSCAIIHLLPALLGWQLFFLLACANLTLAQARIMNQLPPGAPGKDAHWESAGKQGVGTSTTLESKVWFTLQGGALTEVYYPDVSVANVRLLQFVVVNPRTRTVETERDDALHRVEATRPGALSFRQTNTAKSGRWTIVKTYTTDAERSSVLIDVQFQTKDKNLNLYVYYDPSIANSGMHDSAYSPLLRDQEKPARANPDDLRPERKIYSTALGAQEGTIASALLFSSPTTEYTNGYYGTSDGLEQLKSFGKIKTAYLSAVDGNVVQMAKIEEPRHFTVVLSFADTLVNAGGGGARSLAKGFQRCQFEYEKGWGDYLATLRRVGPKYRAQFNMAAMILKAHEDKTTRGAMVASLTVPWGGGPNANEPNTGGYHTVWARDLYQVATAFQLMGDRGAAARALDYLFNIQQRPDGSFPQNSWLDGRAAGGSLQMDEVAYPLVLAYQLGRLDRETWARHVKPAADFLLAHGPATPQERWEEEAGYSPSTIAAEIAGLVCAAEIARRNQDERAAHNYLKTADEWASKVERWTATTSGPHGDGHYYLRITDDDDPNDGAPLEINSNGGVYDERAIVDAGFLELVRLGIRPADDPLITRSLAVVDKLIRVETAHGAAWYRYNQDAYGERDDGHDYDARAGRGRLWTLLTGERGQYELARGRHRAAARRLDAMMGFAGEGLMIPEQVWDKRASALPSLSFGEGTGSATPLAWAMAQFIRLVVNLQEGRNMDTPDIVAARYIKATGKKPLRKVATVATFREMFSGKR
jgi:glucoamylase